MENIYIGVYGTSDKTEVKLEHQNGQVIGYAEVEEANIHLSVKHAWDAISRAINTILKPTAIKLNSPRHAFHMGLGLKYTELVEVCIAFEKAAPEGIKTVRLKSDGYVLCLGTHKHNGSIIIVDQGTVGVALIAKTFYKVGGWGFPHADIGSFPWIGLEAIRLTLQWIDGYIDSSLLIKAVYRYFENDHYKMVKWAMEKRTSPDEYRIIYNIVIDYLHKNDPYAKLLVKESALEIDKLYTKLQQKTNIENLSCSLYGCIAPYIEPLLSENTKKNITHPTGNGLSGAIKMIRAATHDIQNSTH